MKSSYSPIRNYIEQISVKNNDGRLSEVLGVAIEKEFMPSVANLIGTDLKKYLVISKNLFAFNPMHVGRDRRLPIALYKKEEPALVSPAYFSFKIIDEKKLLPEYLEIFFKTEEFDHMCWFYTDSSVRGGLSWDDFCNLKVNIPDIKEQEKIVNYRNKIQKLISQFQAEDKVLLDTGKRLFGEMYKLDRNFKDEISINDYCINIGSGATPSRSVKEYWESRDIPWLKNGEVKNNIVLDTEEYISKKGFEKSSVKIFPAYSVNMAMYCVSDIQVSINTIPLCSNQAVLNFQTNNLRETSVLFFYLYTYGNDITQEANGSAQQNLSKDFISRYKFKRPIISNADFDIFESLIKRRIVISKIIANLSKTSSLLI